MSELRAFTKATSVPWAITPESLQQIFEIAAREHIPDFEAVAARRARRMDGAEGVQIREGGVAVISVTGPIFRYADFFTEFSGGATVSSLARDFTSAKNDPNVTAIVLNIDSPGGEVAGINEFSQMIFDARGKKPIVAYVDGLGASAAYWIASATDEIVADATALLGSIGVVAAVPNPAAKTARDIEFVSSQSPKKRPDPNTESGKAQIQELVDSLADVFVSTMARNRGVSEEKVLADFGQGAVLVGQKAVGAGLADRLGSFEELVAELASAKWRNKRKKMTADEEIEPEAVEEQEMDLAKKFEQLKARLMAAINEEAEPTAQDQIDDIVAGGAGGDAVVLEALEAENTRLRKEAAEAKAAQTKADAESFVDAQIAAARVFPAERDGLLANMLQAAADDLIVPLASGSRVENLKAQVEGRPSHKLTEERIVGGEHRVLRADENNQTEMSEERRRQLLAQTSVGKAALKAVK